MTTVSEIKKLWERVGESDEPHDCPVERGEEFVRCEVCEASMEAKARLQWLALDITQLLLREHDARVRLLTRHVKKFSEELAARRAREEEEATGE